MVLSLPDELVQFLESGVSLSVASRNRRLLPSLARVLACRVDRDAGTLCLWLVRSHAAQLLRDCLDCDRLALVASDPPTHRAWQIKGDGVRECPVTPVGVDLVNRHGTDFADVISRLGFSPSFTRAFYQHRPEELVAISFIPRELFEQTPGPRAGSKVEPGG